MNRRRFFKYGLTAFATLFFSPILSKKGSLAEAADKPSLSETDPMAQTLGYKKDNTKVDVKKFPKKAAADGKNQKCANCQFYKALAGDHGSCQIFPNNSVLANGWCNTWTKKAT